ncbi:YheV family putative metal-binding protein [Endozoicomonas sp. Mp262]|uniref:YheV family putative zinc ribbon protein n=1 Tax=Endozoicomonas sp. Mp262 TaxID=2919499 RepID=UPI0021D8297C
MPIKRFIASAVCPSCGEMDSVRMYLHEGQQFRECVDCGFTDKMPSESTLEGSLPQARIDREEQVLEEDVDIVRIVGDASKGS